MSIRLSFGALFIEGLTLSLYLILPFLDLITQYYTSYLGSPHALTWWEKQVTEEMLEMIELHQFCDTRLICCDGEVSAPRAVVALAYPTFFSMLMELEHLESIILILPQFRLFEVEARIFSRVSCNLEVNNIAIITINIFRMMLSISNI